MVVRFSFTVSATLGVLLAASGIQAQSLDEVNLNLLDDNCINLGHDASTNDPDFGPGLDLICQIPGASGVSSLGGTNASSYTAGVTVADRREVRFDLHADEENRAGRDLFFAVDFEGLNREASRFEDGFDSTIYTVAGGVDTLLSENLLVGALFSYARSHGDFDAGGNFETKSFSPAMYASFLPAPGLFADVSVGYTRHQYDRDRRATYNRTSVPLNGTSAVISGDASSNTSGDQIDATFNFGYDQPFGGLSVGPRAGVNFSHLSVDGYRESGSTGLELEVGDQNVRSFQSVVGLEATMEISTGIGTLAPRVLGDYVHEFENDQRLIEAFYVDDLNAAVPFSFQNQYPDRDFFHVSGGAVLTLPNGLQPFANFRALIGHSYFRQYVVTVGVSVER